MSKYAIEYEKPAAAAYKINNPEADVMCNNCNVLLHAAMLKDGQEDDCDACGEHWCFKLALSWHMDGCRVAVGFRFVEHLVHCVLAAPA